jgi:hypothetical protein
MLSELPGPIPVLVLVTNILEHFLSLTLYQRTREQSACGPLLRLFVDEHDDVRIPRVYKHVSLALNTTQFNLLQALIVADDIVMGEDHQHRCEGYSTIDIR